MNPDDEGVPAWPERLVIATADWAGSARRHLWFTRLRTRGRLPSDFRVLPGDPSGDDEAAGDPTGGGPPPLAVGIPGIREEWRALATWSAALHAEGWDVHLLPDLRRMVAPVADLAEVVQRHLVREDLHNVVLVAHSKGGLVGKAVMISEAGWRIRGMVCVATPFDGSEMAHLVPHVPGMPELTPESPTIRQLARHTDVNARIIQVEAEWDQNVAPSPLPGVRRHVLLPVLGHEAMMDDPQAAVAVRILADQLADRTTGSAAAEPRPPS